MSPLSECERSRERSTFGGAGRREPHVRALVESTTALALAMAVVCTAGVGSAEELLLGITGNYTHNSNFFSSANNEQEANSFQFGPSVELNDPDGRFQYEIGYDGFYQAYTDQDGVNAWESRLRARAEFDITERTRFRMTERFRDVSNLRFSRRDIQLADTALDPNQDRYFRNEVELELIHDLTELLEVRLRSEYNWIDFRQNRDRNDSAAWELGAELRHQLAETHFVGGGASYTRQNFEQARARFGSTAQYVNFYGTWTWIVSESVTFTANGGPSWVRSDEEASGTVEQTRFVGGEQNGQLLIAPTGTCAGLLASNCTITGGIPAAGLGPIVRTPLTPGQRVRTDSVLTFFGGASINASMEAWNLQLTYQRRQSATSGAGLATSLDRLELELEYAHPKVRWSVFVSTAWDHRQTLTDSTVIDYNVVPAPATSPAERGTAFTRVTSDDATRDNITLIAGYRYQLERNFSGTFDVRYRRTEVNASGPNSPGIDTFFAVLSFEYDLDPINF